MPDTDYYSDDSAAPDAQPQEDNSMADYQTTVIPRSLFGQGDVKPGQRITLKVEKVDQDEVVVCKDDEGGEEEEHGDPQHMSNEGPKAPAGSMSSLLED